MQITATPVKTLKPLHWQAWSEIQRTHSELCSPHFSPQLVQCLAEFREGMEVAVFSKQGHIVGFLPYHRNSRQSGEPIAASFSELQGLIAPADLRVDMREVLRACGLSRFVFSDALACQTAFQDYQVVEGVCPYLDLSHGFEAYRLARRNAGSNELQQTLRKARKAEREIAPLRLEPNCQNPVILDMLLDWKQQQLQQRKLANPFLPAWPRQLLHRLLQTHSEEFAGTLSVLYVGDDVAAMTMCVRSHSNWNCWVNCYNPQFHKYSPGLILLAELAQAAERLGISRIDLGRGDESYKKSMSSGGVPVVQGIVERNRFAHLLRCAGYQAREWVRNTPFGDPARAVVRRCRFAISQWKAARAN